MRAASWLGLFVIALLTLPAQGRAADIDCRHEVFFDHLTEASALAVFETCGKYADAKGIKMVFVDDKRLDQPPAIRNSLPPRQTAASCPPPEASRIGYALPTGVYSVAFPFNFGLGLDSVPSDAMKSLLAARGSLTELLKNNPQMVATVVAHADASGNDTINDPLSRRRAEKSLSLIAANTPELQGHLRAEGVGARELRENVEPCDEDQRRLEVRVSLRPQLP